jgi:predicted transcriptional regulator
MNDQPITVPSSATVEQLVNDYIYEYHYKMFPVVDGELHGCVRSQDIKELSRDRWSETTVGELARGCSEENTVGPDEDTLKAFMQMNRHQNSRLMVVEAGRLRGILALKDVMKFLSLKLELEGDQQPPRQLDASPPVIDGSRRE